MQKKRFVSDLQEGELLDELFMIKTARLGETRAGKPYLAITFFDKSGEISGPAWEHAESLQKFCIAGAVVRVCAQVQTYREKLQLKVESINPVEHADDQLEAFVPASHRQSENMLEELAQLIGSIQNSFLKKLLRKIFNKSNSGALFQLAPAAKGIHHAYLGGLLEHSLSMAQVASRLADHYNGINRDLLVAGALLHDIGKTEELRSESGVIDYTDIGRLKGHLVIGCELIGRQAKSLKDFPDELLTHLQHLVLSHHGRHEFGSPVVPMTAEALLLSFIDDMDAKMNLVEQLSRKLKNGPAQWSDYQRSLERFLLLQPLVSEKEQFSEDHEMESDLKQPRLF